MGESGHLESFLCEYLEPPIFGLLQSHTTWPEALRESVFEIVSEKQILGRLL